MGYNKRGFDRILKFNFDKIKLNKLSLMISTNPEYVNSSGYQTYRIHCRSMYNKPENLYDYNFDEENSHLTLTLKDNKYIFSVNPK
jgi:hypothetical protein